MKTNGEIYKYRHLGRRLSDGITEQELLDEYPELEQEDFQAIFAYLTEVNEPSKETIQAMQDARNGKGTLYSSVRAMIH